jgi:predicted Ser/Thr protein kinase
VPPAPEPEDGGTETEAQKEARKKQQKAAALAKGRSSTIFSGSQGDTSQATVKKATLLGE